MNMEKGERIKTTTIGYISLTKSGKALIFKSEAGNSLISLAQLKEVLDGKRDFVRVRLIVE